MQVETVIPLNSECILSFYRSPLPPSAVTEETLLPVVSTLLIDDDMLNDIENLYKVHLVSTRTPETD
jgi:hypothetical protein